MSANRKKSNLPKYFYLLTGLAVIWNLLGVMAFIGQIMITPEMLAQMPIAEQNLYNNTPMWVTVAFAIAVFAGAIGCLVLLMKKALSLNILIISMVAVFVQMFYLFVLVNGFSVYGVSGSIMPIMIIIVAIALVYWAKSLKARGLLS